MTHNDQLTKHERLRLECFAQAINSSFTIRTSTVTKFPSGVSNNERPTLDNIFEQAKRIEEFLKASNPS